MKKTLLLVVSICCMMSAKAQNANNFIQKLDSVCYGSSVERLQYDDRYNCTQIKYVYDYYGQEVVFSTHNFAYDNENRVVRDEYVEMTGVYNLYENTYNEQGLVVERIRTMKNYDELMGYYKYTYEYDADGNLLLDKGFWINDDNEWVESYRKVYLYEGGLLVLVNRYNFGNSTPYESTNYIYNEQRLCIEKATTRGYEVISKTLYTYDESGFLTSETKMDELDGVLDFDEKKEYEFDAEGNCISCTYFEFNKYHETWLFNYSIEYSYDLAFPANDIAGLLTYWNNFEPNFKVLYYKSTDYDFNTNIITFHYSETTGIEENMGRRVSIWPNPVSDLLNIEAEDLQQVKILTLDGKPVMTTKGSNAVSLSTLAQGYYLLKITHSDGRVSFKKFVKK